MRNEKPLISPKEYLGIALRNLRYRPLRSWLTVLGIVVGVFLVITLLSFSEGLNRSIMKELRVVGGRIVMVMPGEGPLDARTFAGGVELEESEMEAIRRVRGVEAALDVPFNAESIRFGGEENQVYLWGIDYTDGMPFFEEHMGLSAREGELPRPRVREVAFGRVVADDMFPDLEPGDEVMISGRRFNVSAILNSLGHRENDSSVIIDMPDYRSVTGDTDGSPYAMVIIEENHDIDVAIADIEETLEETMVRRRGEDSPSFSVLSSQTAIEMIESVLGAVQTAILSLAGIAVIVGAVGIMNTMFTAVKERTREIGILKAVGAKRDQIAKLFLVEAGIVGLLGGTLGTLLGVGFVKLVEWGMRTSPDITFVVEGYFSWGLLVTVMISSFVLGSLSGYLPAKQATALKPVDALRK